MPLHPVRSTRVLRLSLWAAGTLDVRGLRPSLIPMGEGRVRALLRRSREAYTLRFNSVFTNPTRKRGPWHYIDRSSA
jgi:hypothetical protein